MNSALADFTADLLTESGALVEPNADGMEVLLPDAVAGLLEIPEHAKLSFSGDSGEGIFVSYDSELLKKMAKLIGDRGRFSTIALAPSPVRLEKLEDRLEEKLVFHNAVYHVEGKEEKRISYLLGYAKYSARSDDRKEGIVACLINELNLSVQKPTSDILQIIASRAEEPLGGAALANGERVLQAFARAQGAIVEEALSEFLTSMERRLNGDVRRVHDYYQILIYEQRQLSEKKNGAADDKERALSKLDAIQRELKGKIQDLIGKFTIDLVLEPISFIRIETLSPIFWLVVKRRKESRRFPLTYNPILKSLDPLPCEACFYPRNGHYVCDDRLHLVCRQCFPSCQQCGRNYCAACHSNGCPKCGRLKNSSASPP